MRQKEDAKAHKLPDYRREFADEVTKMVSAVTGDTVEDILNPSIVGRERLLDSRRMLIMVLRENKFTNVEVGSYLRRRHNTIIYHAMLAKKQEQKEIDFSNKLSQVRMAVARMKSHQSKERLQAAYVQMRKD